MKTAIILSLGLSVLPACGQSFQQITVNPPARNGALSNGNGISSSTDDQMQAQAQPQATASSPTGSSSPPACEPEEVPPPSLPASQTPAPLPVYEENFHQITVSSPLSNGALNNPYNYSQTANRRLQSSKGRPTLQPVMAASSQPMSQPMASSPSQPVAAAQPSPVSPSQPAAPSSSPSGPQRVVAAPSLATSQTSTSAQPLAVPPPLFSPPSLALGPSSENPSTPPPPRKPGAHSAQLLYNLKGLVFVSSPRQVRARGVSGVVGVKVDGIPILENPDFLAITDKYIGHPFTLDDLNQLVHDVIVYYKQHDRPIVDVSVPEQDVTTGVVQIVAVEARLGKVRVEGNRWFSTADLAGDIRLHPGDPISGHMVSSDAAWLNANPFRQVDVVYTPGDLPGTSDIVLKTQDRLPLRTYVGYENSGNQYTGYNRWLAGFNWGNAFGLDQQLNYQFTANNQYNLYNAQSGSWIIPLPWRHTLTFFGSYSQSRPDTNNPFFTQNGFSWQVSGRYTIPLPGTDAFNEEVVGGFDFKRSNSDLFFGGAPVFATLVDVDQFMAGYNASLVDHYGSTSFNSSFFFSPGGMSEYNHLADFSSSQAGANPHYYYELMQLNRVTKLPADFSLATKVLGQVSSGTLVGSEQFGIGGYATVRGYDERVVNGDSGVVISNELRTPPVSVGQVLGMAGATDQLQFLGFVDYGSVTNSSVINGPGTSSSLIGVGPGLRYLINPYFSFRADYGFQLKDANVPGITNHSYLELGGILSY